MTLILLHSPETRDSIDIFGQVGSYATVGGRQAWAPSGIGATFPMSGGEMDDGITIGGRFFWSGAVNDQFFRLSGDGGTNIHLVLQANNAMRRLDLRRSAPGGTILASTEANTLPVNSWAHFELQVKIADSGGTAELRHNGSTVMTYLGDTRSGGTDTNIDLVLFNGPSPGSSPGAWICDLSLLNEQGAGPDNTFLGDSRNYVLYPDGAGNYTNLTPTGSGTNWQNVDEVNIPSATDYNGHATAGTIDTYTLDDLPVTTGTIHGVELRMYAWKSDTGNKQIRSVIRRAATDAFGDDKVLAVDPRTYRQLYALDPVAAAAWTITNVNDLEIGAEVRT